jgi:hypothetical protein
VDLPAHARAFLEQLQSVLPAGYVAVVEPAPFGSCELWIKGPELWSGYAADWLLDTAVLEDDALAGATWALEQAQSVIAELSTEPWPATWRVGYHGGLPAPQAELVDDQLYVWFGDRASPLLELGPTDLRDVILKDTH